MSALIILWSQVQVLVGPPEMLTPVRDSWGFYNAIMTLRNKPGCLKCKYFWAYKGCSKS